LKDQLSAKVVTGAESDRVDACLSSNIIEVGVDIDRLSLMAVVGQPKSTASYIQATGRVGRRWWERPGLILTLLNPFKSRDTSHYEQFHTYHRRLYERVEPTSATPFSLSAIQRGLIGAVIAHVRQQVHSAPEYDMYEAALDHALELFRERCESIGLDDDDCKRSLEELNARFERFRHDWKFFRPQQWFDWNQPEGMSLLMLLPGKYASPKQRYQGFNVPTSLRDVDAQAELALDYFQQDWMQA
jgi:Lhr-like helicase